jgi:hypothetical protein
MLVSYSVKYSCKTEYRSSMYSFVIHQVNERRFIQFSFLSSVFIFSLLFSLVSLVFDTSSQTIFLSPSHLVGYCIYVS